MTVMVVVQQYASYRVDVSQVGEQEDSGNVSFCQVYIIYYLIFVLALCVALSYALVVLFEVRPLSSCQAWYQTKQGADCFHEHKPMAYQYLLGRGVRGATSR